MIKTYYELAKPGIIYGNALPALAAFIFASSGPINWILLIATLVGLSLIIGSGCVFNNYADREIDARMERTKGRAFPAQHVSLKGALIYGVILGVVGILILFFLTTPLALGAAIVGFVVYVGIYTPLKPRSPYALFVGAIAGAVPPVVGYSAVTNTLDIYAVLLFAVLYLWQIPHFLAIATYRYSEYKAAGVPLFITSEPSDTAKQRARKIFLYSLVVLVVFCGALIFQRWVR
jgi:protoheme IX farnesyltransferase